MPLVYIIVLNWNGWEMTSSCLSSLRALTYPNFRILVVDNGSTDGSPEKIRSEWPEIELLETGENLGFAGGNNQGILAALKAQADYILLLNNDTTVDPSLVQEFVAHMQTLPNPGILGATVYLHSKPTHLDHLGGIWNPKRSAFDLIGHLEPARMWTDVMPLDYVCGCAFFVSRAVFSDVGLLDPRFFLYWEESDFCFRARKQGWKSYSIPTAKVWHHVSASFVGGKPHSTYFFHRNRLLWLEKHCRKKIPKILSVSLFRYIKLYCLKSLHVLYGRIFGADSALQHERLAKLCLYRAALCGLFDYTRRRFGSSPSSLSRR